DAGTYGSMQPDGVYVVNAPGGIYYYSPGAGYTQISGGAVQVAATDDGGLFALAYATEPGGHQLYYYDVSAGTWTQESGGGTAIATNSTAVYAVAVGGGIYEAPVTQLIVVTPSSLAFLGAGSANAQTLAVSESGYAGTFSIDAQSTCITEGVVSVAPTSGSSSFTVTPQGAGSCALSILDQNGHQTTVPVSVTT